MMMLYRLVRLIENNSKVLATCLLDRVQNSEATPDYEDVPQEELKERVYEIYRHLGDWLITKNEFDLEERYLKIGARRAQQKVPFSQVAWAIILTKDNLWEFLKKESVPDRPVEVLANWRCCSCLITSLIGRFTMPQSATNEPLRSTRLRKNWHSRQQPALDKSDIHRTDYV